MSEGLFVPLSMSCPLFESDSLFPLLHFHLLSLYLFLPFTSLSTHLSLPSHPPFHSLSVLFTICYILQDACCMVCWNPHLHYYIRFSAWVCKITLGHYAFINYDCARRKMKNHCSVIWLSLQTALAQVTGFTLGTEGDGSLHCAILTLPCWCWCLVFNLNARSTD